MSTEEQLKEIGKLATERAKAKGERNALLRRIQSTGRALNSLAPLLMREYPDMPNLNAGGEILDHLIGAGGLDRTRKDITEYIALQGRIAHLSRILQDAGAE
jgi:hypothetical protein